MGGYAFSGRLLCVFVVMYKYIVYSLWYGDYMTKHRVKNIICGMLVLIAIITIFLLNSDVFGVSAAQIEQDARVSQAIDNEWAVSKASNQKLCAMIFYNDAQDDYTVSIYINRIGFSFGYFFFYGGGAAGIMDGVHEFDYDIYGSALISMNKENISRIELDNGVEVTTISVDPEKPFAVVIPMNCGSVTLFDINDTIVPITDVERQSC